MKMGVFAGRVGQDAEVKYTTSGLPVASFSIACNRIGKDNEGEKQTPLWVRATLWRDRAEKLAPYIKKGSFVTVTGEIDVRSWTGKDGEHHASLEVNVDKLDFGGGPKGDAAPAKEEPKDPQNQGPISDADIPF